MEKKTVQIKKSAMLLVDDGHNGHVKFSAASDGTAEEFEMTAYSGGIIKNHFWWGDLAIDLEGMSIPKKKIPILEDHNTSMKIGFATKMSKDNHQLTVADSQFVDTPESIKFRETSSQGFPYEASMYVKPTNIQSLQENETAEVNGYTMKGPGTIFRKSVLKEVSVCTFGYDPNTSSKAFAEMNEDVEIEYQGATQLTNKEEEKVMTFAEMKEKYPELCAQLSAEAIADVEAKFSQEKTVLETQLTAAKEENARLSAANKDQETRLSNLEKAEGIRQEQAIQLAADSEFNTRFTAAGLPERLHGKIKKLVNHEAFVADGKLDKTAFGAAIDAELADWKNPEDTVLGLGGSGKDAVPGAADTKLTDDVSDRMAGYFKD